MRRVMCELFLDKAENKPRPAGWRALACPVGLMIFRGQARRQDAAMVVSDRGSSPAERRRRRFSLLAARAGAVAHGTPGRAGALWGRPYRHHRPCRGWVVVARGPIHLSPVLSGGSSGPIEAASKATWLRRE